MDSVDRPGRSRLARAFAKVFHIRAGQGNKRLKSRETVKIDGENVKRSSEQLEGDGDEKLRERMAVEAFVAKLLAGISAVKASYAELQFAQSPYDPQGIHFADQMVVSEFQFLSELRQSYSKMQIVDRSSSPETTLLLAEIKEQKCIVRTYEIMAKKLDSQDKLKGSEITFLKDTLSSSFELSAPDKLIPSHFIKILGQAVSSIRSFVRLLSLEMESAGWDLDAAASSIQPGVAFLKPNHKYYAFESFVSREMFDGFNHPNFNISSESLTPDSKPMFDRFMELKPVKPGDHLAWKPRSSFANYCCKKYLRLIHPDMEQSLFGNEDQRKMVKSRKYPETDFFTCFVEMAKRIWLLHCLAFSFNPEASIFIVRKGTRFSDVYMDNANDEPLLSWDGSPETEPRVAFIVLPGFRIGKTIIQCQVYLC